MSTSGSRHYVSYASKLVVPFRERWLRQALRYTDMQYKLVVCLLFALRCPAVGAVADQNENDVNNNTLPCDVYDVSVDSRGYFLIEVHLFLYFLLYKCSLLCNCRAGVKPENEKAETWEV